MCRFTGVSRSAYYDWLHRAETTCEKADFELKEVIKQAFSKSRATYGTRRLKEALINHNQRVSRRRIGRLMRETNLACKTKRKFKATTNSNHDLPVAPAERRRHGRAGNAGHLIPHGKLAEIAQLRLV